MLARTLGRVTVQALLGLSVSLALCFPLASAASPPTALSLQALGDGAQLELRPRPNGIELWMVSSTVPQPARARLLSPRGRAGAWTDLYPGDNPTHVGLLPRPARTKAADRDLRVELDTGTRRFISVVSRFQRAPRILLLGDTKVYAGGRYSPRIVVRNGIGDCAGPGCARALPGALVHARLVKDGKPVSEARGTSDSAGAVTLDLHVPDRAKGAHTLLVSASTDAGTANADLAISVKRAARILLSTDKPLYQPGQTVHVRLLARRRGNGRAAGSLPASVVFHDAKNNKVFQRRGKTSPEGVFSADLELASMVNMGRWRIEATVGSSRTERTIDVKHYVLPKFKVEVTTDRPWYLPGAKVTGTVSARYFFGKPVAGGSVDLRVRTTDVGLKDIARLSLKLDGEGRQPFSLQLPKVLHGRPELRGGAPLLLAAEVRDTAGQAESGRHSVTVAAGPLLLTALPEAGKLVPRVENVVYILATRPDGTPAPGTRVEVAFGKQHDQLKTDANGIAVWRGVPKEALNFHIQATAPDGATANLTQGFGLRDKALAAQILLRPDDPTPRAGERVGFDVFVAGTVPHVFMDIVRDGQTLVTMSAPVKDGRARLETTLPPEAGGTVLAHAYALGDDMEVYGDTRPLVVRLAQDLTVELKPDKETYRPGEEAKVDIQVTDGQGHPVLTALGLWVVDEAVFAVSELKPGLEKLFFLLEAEIMRPKVEIHGLHPHDTVANPDPERRRQAARVIAAAAMPGFVHDGPKDSQAQERGKSQDVWQKQLDRKAKKLAKPLREWSLQWNKLPSGDQLYKLLARFGVTPDVTVDAFGVPYRLNVARHDNRIAAAELLSAGPDATWKTRDDLSANLGLGDVQQALWRRQERREARRWRRRGKRGGMLMMGAGGMGMRGVGLGGGGMAGGRVMGMARMDTGGGRGAPGGGAAPRVRSFFPETLYVNPLLLTDAQGRAQVTIPLADSITSWRMTALASSNAGGLGSATTGIRVFQDFFVDIDVPVSLTRGDEVSVPVAVYNYLDVPQTVRLELQPSEGVEVLGRKTLEVPLAAGEVKGVSVTLKASRVGRSELTVMAHGTGLSDAVRRPIRVEPDGFAVTSTRSSMLEDGTTELVVEVPDGGIEHAGSLQLKLFPGVFAQVVDGLESMLRMPSGCFEQTSSTTYPNALVLDYLRRSEKSKPELEAKALRYLQAGWQRLVTFEVRGGGFSWFGDAPANQILTAYGLMEFRDMDRVMAIDDKVVRRTRRWLAKQQQRDGSWKPDANFLHQESWGSIQKSSLMVTSYVAWALAYSRSDRAKVDKPLRRGLAYLVKHADEARDPYVLSYLANALAEALDGRSDATEEAALDKVLARLQKLAKRGDRKIWFETKAKTATYGSGVSARVETSALVLRSFMRAKQNLELVKPGLGWLVSAKDSHGSWHSTQASIQALQALLGSLSTQQPGVAGSIAIEVNGQDLAPATYSAEDFDVVRFVDATSALRPGRNVIRLTPSKGLSAMASATATEFLPWDDKRRPAVDAFAVQVSYDRTKLAKDDTVGVAVTVTSNQKVAAKMGIVDVGIPPGFVLDPTKLEQAVKSGQLQRFTLAGRQLILYVPQFAPGVPFQVAYELKARYPLRASSGAATAYEYYDPASRGTALPVAIAVD